MEAHQRGVRMSDTNSVTLVGRLTRDAEVKEFGETTILNMRLAVNSRKKVGGSWEDAPGFFDVVHFPRGGGLAPLLTRGKQIALTGRLSWREWETKSGDKRQSVEVIANDVQLLGGREQGAPVNDDLGEFKKQMGATEVNADSIPF
jgi:single-strand DNA-binding protein